MARQITIYAANQLNFGATVQVQVDTFVNGVKTSEKYYTFNANQFSCVYDTSNVNYAILHMSGNTFQINNGDYDTFVFTGIPGTLANVQLLAAAVVNDIAQYTT